MQCNQIIVEDKEVGNGGSRSPLITSTKGATGHLLGAAGAVEAIFSVLAVNNNIVPPTMNLENPDEDFDGLRLVRGEAIHNEEVNVALSNSFGFGGTNCSLCFTKYVDE